MTSKFLKLTASAMALGLTVAGAASAQDDPIKLYQCISLALAGAKGLKDHPRSTGFSRIRKFPPLK